MRIGKLLFLTFIALPLLFAQTPPGNDEYWPKEIDTDNLHLVLYLPQVDSWKGNRIEARSAVIVAFKGDTTQIFGTVSISARTEVDREARLVSLEDINVKEANFPSASSLQGKLRECRSRKCSRLAAIPYRSTGSWRIFDHPNGDPGRNNSLEERSAQDHF